MATNPNIAITDAAGESVSTHVETLTVSGPWAASQTARVSFQRNGNTVHVTIPAMTAGCTVAAAATITAVTPTTFRPSAAVSVPMRVLDNATYTTAVAKINTTGTIVIYADTAASAFAGAGNATWEKTVLTYSV